MNVNIALYCYFVPPVAAWAVLPRFLTSFAHREKGQGDEGLLQLILYRIQKLLAIQGRFLQRGDMSLNTLSLFGS